MRTHPLKTFFRKVYNYFFCLRFPFWKSRNVWSDKLTGYKYTLYDQIEYGWKKAFGKKLSKDLKKALKKDKLLKEFRLTQIKEKHGMLCLYNNGVGQETKKVIDYYENLSVCYCIFCGKPARYRTSSDLTLYVCSDCFETDMKMFESKNLADLLRYKRSCRLTAADIPKTWQYTDDKKELIDYGIDYHTLWGLRGKAPKNKSNR